MPPLPQTVVCRRNRPTVARVGSLEGVAGEAPRPWGDHVIGSDTRPRRLWLRLSTEEDDALASAAKAYGITKTDLVRLLVRYVRLPSTHLLAGAPIVFDYGTSHEVAYNLHAIGTLYNQSVRALNTMAKGVREAEADPADVMEVLAAVHADMAHVKNSLDRLREDVSALSDRPSLFTW